MEVLAASKSSVEQHEELLPVANSSDHATSVQALRKPDALQGEALSQLVAERHKDVASIRDTCKATGPNASGTTVYSSHSTKSRPQSSEKSCSFAKVENKDSDGTIGAGSSSTTPPLPRRSEKEWAAGFQRRQFGSLMKALTGGAPRASRTLRTKRVEVQAQSQDLPAGTQGTSELASTTSIHADEDCAHMAAVVKERVVDVVKVNESDTQQPPCQPDKQEQENAEQEELSSSPKDSNAVNRSPAKSRSYHQHEANQSACSAAGECVETVEHSSRQEDPESPCTTESVREENVTEEQDDSSQTTQQIDLVQSTRELQLEHAFSWEAENNASTKENACTEDRPCTTPSIGQDTTTVTPITPQTPIINAYADDYQQGDFSHCVEVYDLNKDIRTSHLQEFLDEFQEFHTCKVQPLIRWADDWHAVFVCPDPATADLLLDVAPAAGWSVRSFEQACQASKQLPNNELMPPRARPKTTTAVARRLLSHALARPEIRNRAIEKELADARSAAKQERAARHQALASAWDDDD